jgi:hypothetical protein
MPPIDEVDWLLSGRCAREEFMEKFKSYIVEWVTNNEALIIRTIKNEEYSWKGESYEASMKRRDVLEYLIGKSKETKLLSGVLDVTFPSAMKRKFWKLPVKSSIMLTNKTIMKRQNV